MVSKFFSVSKKDAPPCLLPLREKEREKKKKKKKEKKPSFLRRIAKSICLHHFFSTSV